MPPLVIYVIGGMVTLDLMPLLWRNRRSSLALKDFSIVDPWFPRKSTSIQEMQSR